MQDMKTNELVPETAVSETSAPETSTSEGGKIIPESAVENKVQYAGFFTRAAAFCIDSFVAGVLLLVVRIPRWLDVLGGTESLLNTNVLFEFTGWDIIIYLLTCLYFVVLTYNSGATFGKRLLHIKVISTEDEKLSFIDVLYRETIGRFLCTVIMNMGYILVGLDKEKRGFHDMLSDTRVVYDFEVKQKKKDTEETGKTENTEKSGKSGKTVRYQASNYGYVSDNQKTERNL